MTGLLLKDLYNTRKQLLWYAVMIVAFCVISVLSDNVAFAGTMGLLVTISVPITAIAYEERDGWQKFVVASGLNAKVIVGEKYLLGLAAGCVSAIGVVLSACFAQDMFPQLITALWIVCYQVLLLAVVLPLVVRFGVERGRVFMVVAMCVLMGVIIALLPLLEEGTVAGLIGLACSAAVVLLLLLLSWLLSVAICRKKQF